LLIIGAGAALLGAGEGGLVRAFIIRPLTTPIIIGSLSGAVLALLRLPPPLPVAEFMALLGRAAGPVGLFSIGVFLAARRAAPLFPLAPRIAAVAVVKLVALPAMALILFALLAPADPAAKGALALFTLTPTAATAYVMASQFGHSARETAAFIAATTILSLMTISYALIAFAPAPG
jgi:predicted permease